MRAVTRTTLSLGDLLEIPIGICAATGSSDLKFEAGVRPGTELPEDPVEEVPVEEVPEDAEAVEETGPGPVFIKGVKIGDELREVPGSEFEWAAASTKLSSVQVLEFCDYRQVPTDRLQGSFWVQPDAAFGRPMAVLMKAMREKRRAMVVKFNLKSRQRLGVIRVRRVEPGSDRLGFLLNAVVYAADWRAPDDQVLAPWAALGEVDDRAVGHAITIMDDLAGDGSWLHKAEDDLITTHTRIAERAIDGLYDSPDRILRHAAEVRSAYPERAWRLVDYVLARWPEYEAKRDEAVALIVSDDEDAADKLVALVG